jgi:hypothetical protein
LYHNNGTTKSFHQFNLLCLFDFLILEFCSQERPPPLEHVFHDVRVVDGELSGLWLRLRPVALAQGSHDRGEDAVVYAVVGLQGKMTNI